MTGFVAAFAEGPIDFYKSQVQVQIIRTQSDPNYKREPAPPTVEHHQHHLMLHTELPSPALRAKRPQVPAGVPAAAGAARHAMCMLGHAMQNAHSGPHVHGHCTRARRLALQCTRSSMLSMTWHAAAFTSVSSAVKRTIQINGFKGPFQGLFATIVRNAPANSVYLGSFEVGWHTNSALTMHALSRSWPQAGHTERRLCVCVIKGESIYAESGGVGAVTRDWWPIAALTVLLHWTPKGEECGCNA